MGLLQRLQRQSGQRYRSLCQEVKRLSLLTCVPWPWGPKSLKKSQPLQPPSSTHWGMWRLCTWILLLGSQNRSCCLHWLILQRSSRWSNPDIKPATSVATRTRITSAGRKTLSNPKPNAQGFITPASSRDLAAWTRKTIPWWKNRWNLTTAQQAAIKLLNKDRPQQKKGAITANLPSPQGIHGESYVPTDWPFPWSSSPQLRDNHFRKLRNPALQAFLTISPFWALYPISVFSILSTLWTKILEQYDEFKNSSQKSSFTTQPFTRAFLVVKGLFWMLLKIRNSHRP